MSQTQTLGKVATSVQHEGILTIVRYHATDVVKFSDAHITLNSGGWRTNTTKLRMNQASNQFGLGFTVYQRMGQWFVRFNMRSGTVIPFEDGMILQRVAVNA
jgi:hypothetical protein